MYDFLYCIPLNCNRITILFVWARLSPRIEMVACEGLINITFFFGLSFQSRMINICICVAVEGASLFCTVCDPWVSRVSRAFSAEPPPLHVLRISTPFHLIVERFFLYFQMSISLEMANKFIYVPGTWWWWCIWIPFCFLVGPSLCVRSPFF